MAVEKFPKLPRRSVRAYDWPQIIKYALWAILAISLAFIANEISIDFKATNIELHIRRK